MSRAMLFSVIAALALGACGGNQGAADETAVADKEANVTADEVANAGESASSIASADFAAAVAASDMYEIESGRLASEKASSAALKGFGEMLVTDHQKSTRDLEAAGSQARPTVSVMPMLKPEQQQMLDALRSARGLDFDRTFVEQQKHAHQKALDLLQRYSTEGDVKALKSFAAKAVPVVKAHLDRLHAMKP